mmetsp:Transcript_51968/g.101779  ORF Transcript_51968/g.101779 Transcript_51968/m.101779 type:complete len:105 (+) Transcript_51968:1477-1791(+)
MKNPEWGSPEGMDRCIYADRKNEVCMSRGGEVERSIENYSIYLRETLHAAHAAWVIEGAGRRATCLVASVLLFSSSNLLSPGLTTHFKRVFLPLSLRLIRFCLR